MKEKINKCLLESWCSLYKGIDSAKASDKLIMLFNSELIKTHKIYEDVLFELRAYKDTQSNNPNKLEQLNQLIKDIEEQIDNE
jgi:hypothetical protein